MRWQDTYDIALSLVEHYPEQDPMTTGFVQLHQLIIQLPEFKDNPEASNEAILEGIFQAWLDERE